MAFPTIADADTTNGTQTSNSTSWAISLPGNRAVGDLLLVFVGHDGNSGFAPNPSTGWVGMCNQAASGGAANLEIWGRIVDGSEGSPIVYSTNGTGEQGGWRVFRIPAASWFGSGIGVQIGGTAEGNGTHVTVDATGSPSSTPDPPSANPANWDVEDTLWIAAIAVDTSRTISAYPLADRNTADVSGGSTGATLGICTTTSAAASLNPGTFTISSSDDWAAATVAIRPAGLTAKTRSGWVNHQNPAWM